MKKKKKARGSRRSALSQFTPFSRRIVRADNFKPDVTERKLASVLFDFPGGILTSFLTIDSLDIARTVGKGRTNLTFIRPTIVQADAATPFASFDLGASTLGRPAISMHFEPQAYGITAPVSFLMVFSIQCFGTTTFNIGGFAGNGTLENTGTKTFSGTVAVSLGFKNVPATQQTHGFLEQTGGSRWSFFSARTRFPFPVLSQA